MPIHRSAAVGFSRGAAEYARVRPGYPREVVELLRDSLGLGPGRSVLDLAAGTGKLTVELAATGAHVVAVEPVAEMRAELSRELPHVPALPGTAEAIPLADGAVDAVTAAQAFHWFDHARALPEIHRVLRGGGRLAVVWNVWDDASAPWVGAIAEILRRHAGETPQYRSSRWREALVASPLFAPPTERAVSNPQEVDRETFLARIASISFVAALPGAERERVLAEARAALPAEDEVLRFAYRTEVVWCERRGDPVPPESV